MNCPQMETIMFLERRGMRRAPLGAPIAERKDWREIVPAGAEKACLVKLMARAGSNIRESCRLSGFGPYTFNFHHVCREYMRIFSQGVIFSLGVPSFSPFVLIGEIRG